MKFYSIIPRVLQFIAWWPTYFAFRFFYGFEAKGMKNLRGLKQAIFACNHSNELDTIMLTAAATPFGPFAPMFYVSRETSFYKDDEFGWRKYLYGEFFFALWGAFKAYAGLKDYEKSLKNHIQLLGDGYSLCIFPEGGMTKDGKMREGHGGVSFLSYKTGVPVVPVHIKGTYKFSFASRRPRGKGVTLVFGKPMYIKEENFKQDAQKIMAEIAAL